MATLFAICVVIVVAGVVWFHVVRPILVDFGVIGVGIEEANTVNTSAPIMSPAPAQTTPDQQTDSQTDPVSEADQWLDRLELDRTRVTWVELMVYIGYSVGEIRTLLKGDNGAIGTEVEAAKKKLGIVDEPRQLRVRDEKGERMIPMEVP